MLVRQGQYPTPTIALALVSLALLSFIWAMWRPKFSRRLAACTAVFLGFGVVPAFMPGAVASWKSWPPYHPIVGFGKRDANTLLNADLYERMASDVNTVSRPKEPLFVALDRNAGHFANAAALYWALDRPPATRFLEFDPCLTDREDVQRLMIPDLAKVNVIITHNFWQNRDFSEPPAHSLDEYIRSNFTEVRIYQLPGKAEAYRLLVRGQESSAFMPQLPNRSFEGGSAPPWMTWSRSSARAVAVNVECTKSYHGSCALQQAGRSGITFQETSGLVPGNQYEITAWAISDPGSTARVSLWVHDGAEHNAAVDNTRTPDSKHWERFAVRFLASQTGKVRIHLNYDTGVGAAYWDNVRITPVW